MTLVNNASIRIQLTANVKPALSAKSVISFCLDAKLYIGERRTAPFSHGLSDEEKKKTSDNFELHLELGDSRGVAVILIGFFVPKPETGLI